MKNIFRAYETNDKAFCEKMLTDDFNFKSRGNNDHINKAAYFEKCWPFNEQRLEYELEKITITGNEVFVLYTCKFITGKKIRDVEYFKIEKEKIKEIQVCFGNAGENI